MSGETITTVAGNLGSEVELRYTGSGVAVASFTVASTPRTFDKTTQEWRDGDTLWMPVTVWREQAENCAESLTKGARVVVQGRLTQENWEDKNGGGKRSRVVLQADDVAVSLLRATATVAKVQRQGAPAQRGGQQTEADPWATGGAF